MKTPFLFGFLSALPVELDPSPIDATFDPQRQCGVLPDGELAWSMARRYPTSCYTSGRYRPGYRNKKGKWLSGKYISGRRSCILILVSLVRKQKLARALTSGLR